MDGTDGQTRRDEPTEGSTRGPRGPKMLHTNQYVKEIVTHLMPILTKSNWYSVTIPYWYFQNVLFSISITFFKSSFSSFLSQLGEIIPKKSFFRNPKWDRNYNTRPGPETEVIFFPCLQKSRQTSVECVFRQFRRSCALRLCGKTLSGSWSSGPRPQLEENLTI